MSEPDYSLIQPPFTRQCRSELRELSETVFGPQDATAAEDFAWRLASMPMFTAFTARSEGQLVGFKLGYAHTRHRYYSWLGGVHPEYRHQGIARTLMANQHSWLIDAGFSIVETSAREENAAMIGLNRSCGFAVIGRREAQFVDIILSKTLTD